ncbi:hypothetical protein UCRPC4_g04413 [Phaeomoniella chlamydospora]|uniref:Uncharacterized protein n=1 Tax=Phaeomoniella chlamydospora TaxID=158046 RepID=A0A0G2E9P1_PHACM|nr:hypothetical protein UCRPC4_g04413 [Phaeomoniella chlamydospora]
MMSQLTGMMNNAASSEGGLAGVVDALGSGLGSGAIEGLDIKSITKNPLPGPSEADSSGFNKLAYGLGNGLASGLFGAINASALTSTANTQDISDLVSGLGSGLGSGATQGLSVAKADASTTTAANGTFGQLASSFGNGLSDSFLGSLDTSKLTSTVNTQSIMQQVGQIAGSVGQGLGNGAAEGLRSAANSPFASNSSSQTSLARRQQGSATSSGSASLSDVALNFSQNLASSFVGNVNFSQLGGTVSSQQLLTTVAQVAPGVGEGLGSGAAKGLQIMMQGASGTSTTTSLVRLADTGSAAGTNTSTSASSVASSFSFNLASSFLGDTNISSLGSGVSMKQLLNTVAEAAPGLGAGLGSGAAQGLGLVNASGSTDVSSDNTSVSAITESFSQQLSFSFLNGVNLKSLAQKSGISDSMSSLTNLNLSQVSGNLASGLVSGASSQLFPNASIQANSSTSNNSINQIANGFGQGLGQEGTRVILALIGNKAQSATTSSSGNTSSLNITLKRSLGSLDESMTMSSHGQVRELIPYPKYQRSQRRSVTAASASSLLQNINFTEVNTLVQKAVNALQCEGVGGIFQVFAGLKQSGSLDTSSLTKGQNFMFPDTTLNITSDDNLFKVNLGQQTLTVNGNSVSKLTLLLIIHSKSNASNRYTILIPRSVIFMIIAVYNLLPMSLILSSISTLTNLFGVRESTLRLKIMRFLISPKTLTILHILILIFTLISLLFGILANGSASHFHTPHQILGFFMVGMVFATSVCHLYISYSAPTSNGAQGEDTDLANKTEQTPEESLTGSMKFLSKAQFVLANILVGLAQLQLLLGFTDLNAITLCLTSTVTLPQAVGIGGALSSQLFLATGAITTQLLVGWWDRKRRAATSSEVISPEKNNGPKTKITALDEKNQIELKPPGETGTSWI